MAKMIAKQFLATGFLTAALAIGCSPAEPASGETWDTVNAKLSKFNEINDCDGAWHLFWSTRENNETYSYLMLSALAARGEHPWQPADAKQNDDIAFSLAALAHRYGQIPKLEELGEGYKVDSLLVPLTLVQALVMRVSSGENARYHDEQFVSCFKSAIELNTDKFDECFGHLLEDLTRRDAIITLPPIPAGAHVQCVESKGFDFR
ncbi:hypothetical protein HB777_15910 [Mesorhizobium loti]|nr:hypothetical protein HB777_15910 [Mesorhizobium loti]